ncbi:MAG TPA: tetratricopeptide repeat protein, partial [Burkholderiaceae bacterium]
MSGAAITRNAPCPCGSGKRYKDCHGAAAGIPGEPVSATSLLRDAQVAFALGHVADAHALLGRAVALTPDRADLWRERARVEMALGNLSLAEESCRAALDRVPGDVTAWILLGEILHRSDPEAGEAAWRHALTLDPQSGEASFH